ncbi:MAG: Maf family nucleotide pyrophosphatase [Flavobacteriaceae bacterium]
MIDTNGFELILASGSPRRKAFFEEMELPFRVQVLPVNENFPSGLDGIAIAQHIVRKKAEAFLEIIKEKQLVITADTVVWHKNQFLGKPQNNNEAKTMLRSLSNDTHDVITAVGFLQKTNWEMLFEVSQVCFGTLSDNEIDAYVKTGSPLDKAGAYGIQDPFGIRNVTFIKGSYSNIIGLPVPQVLKKIREITSKN